MKLPQYKNKIAHFLDVQKVIEIVMQIEHEFTTKL